MRKKNNIAKKATDKNEVAIQKHMAPEVLDALKQELSKLKEITDTPYKTNGNIDKFNIKTSMKQEELLCLFGYVIIQEKAYVDAAIDLDINPCPEFKYNGSTLAEWRHDIKLRISILTHDFRKKELTKLIEEGKSFLTREDQYNMYLKKVATTIKKINK